MSLEELLDGALWVPIDLTHTEYQMLNRVLGGGVVLKCYVQGTDQYCHWTYVLTSNSVTVHSRYTRYQDRSYWKDHLIAKALKMKEAMK